MAKILSEDKKNAVLSSTYSEIVNVLNQISMTTRSAAKEEPTTYISLSLC